MANMEAQLTITHIQNNKCLWYKVHVFCYDLRNFREKAESRQRLDAILDTSYIGTPYFTDAEAHLIKSTVIERATKHSHKAPTPPNNANDENKTLAMIIEATLQEKLERRMKKRVESGDYRVCAAHDLAPVFEKAFGIDVKKLARDASFLKVMSTSGIELKAGDEWKGPTQKLFQKRNKKR